MKASMNTVRLSVCWFDFYLIYLWQKGYQPTWMYFERLQTLWLLWLSSFPVHLLLKLLLELYKNLCWVSSSLKYFPLELLCSSKNIQFFFCCYYLILRFNNNNNITLQVVCCRAASKKQKKSGTKAKKM